uniref:Acylglycerol kinase, mitochondrial n=1 Tax=Geotrypetes seraphini TaxID=260995 RepID=A0A6P8SBW2_GEOSA|nr:acylglycerol kinase, mitochondrial isoform X2 [Geotrypetes seraphini]
MVKVMGVLKMLKNHWKKSTAGFCLLAYGSNWLYGKHCDNLLRRAACQEAQTDYEGQAKKLIELLDRTDLIIVAGGSGTLQEVVTGLLRRTDEAIFSKIPIGFIPLGITSTLSHTLYLQSSSKVKQITDATLAILKGETVPLDVLQIKGKKDQPVFAMTGLRWGSYRDAAAKVSKYWYLGPLRNKAAHFFCTFKEWPQKHQALMMYLGPTERPPEQPVQKLLRPPLYIRFYRRLVNYWAQPKKDVSWEMTSETWEQVQLSAIELSISTQNSQLNLMRTEDSMNICIELDTVNKADFITLGSQKLRNPQACPDGSCHLQASQCSLQLQKGTEGFFSIDDEEYEAMSVEVTLLPQKLQFLCDSKKKHKLLQQDDSPRLSAETSQDQPYK